MLGPGFGAFKVGVHYDLAHKIECFASEFNQRVSAYSVEIYICVVYTTGPAKCVTAHFHLIYIHLILWDLVGKSPSVLDYILCIVLPQLSATLLNYVLHVDNIFLLPQ